MLVGCGLLQQQQHFWRQAPWCVMARLTRRIVLASLSVSAFATRWWPSQQSRRW